MTDQIIIRLATADDLLGLAEVLVDCVEGGASVSFMSPLDVQRASAFWTSVLDGAALGERIVLVAQAPDGTIVGTVQLILSPQENQPHRAELGKMLVHSSGRRRGVAEALMGAAERAAIEVDRWLLVLDTSSPDAERLYERLGWERIGVIRDFALLPQGGLVQSTFYVKDLRA